ncbi:MAG: hypothetical protein LBP56_01885 [Odoribacteraceae bacterium]|jgi:hypothetical protein|nr:hypothetical protein [Odoribacteraceae bacterium]
MRERQEVFQDLRGGLPGPIDRAIQEIREGADVSIVPELLDMLLHAHDVYLVSRLTALLADVKEPAMTGLLMDRLVATGDGEEQARLLRVCWESALDFSGYLDVFAGLLLAGDYITALEAATVMMHLNGDIAAGRRARVIRQLREASTDEDRTFLVEEVIQSLSRQEMGDEG